MFSFVHTNVLHISVSWNALTHSMVMGIISLFYLQLYMWLSFDMQLAEIQRGAYGCIEHGLKKNNENKFAL